MQTPRPSRLLAPLALAALAAGPPAPESASPAAPALHYPETRRGDVVDDYFGVKVPDPYRWLEDDESEETKAWVRAENALTERFLEAIPERPAIRARVERLWDHERFSKPVKRGGRYFYLRNSGLQPQDVLYVADGHAGEGRVLLDPNLLSKDGTVALSGWSATDDGRLLAYAVSEAGSDWLAWRVREVQSGEDRPDLVRWAKFSGAAWRKDGSGFYYARYPEPKGGEELKGVNQNHQVFFHRLGTPQARDRLVFARPDQPEWGLSPEVSDDGRWLIITAWKGTNPENAVFVQDLRRRGSRPVPFLDRMDAAYEVVDNRGDTFLVRTDKDAPRGRLVAIRLGRPEPGGWKEIIPQGPRRDVLEQVTLVGGRLFALWMRDVKSAVEVYDLEGRKTGEVALPDVGSAAGFHGRADERETFYLFTSFTAPPTIYRLETATLASAVFRRPQVDFDPDAYETEQVFFSSRDGTRVPMFLVHRKGMARDGRNPAILYGYGGFRVSLAPAFSAARIAWLELGGLYAVANLRGGDEYGKEWYDAGRLAKKQNVFDDAIGAAEWLLSSGWTSRERLAASGASNGGLLVGAMLTQRPDLLGAAVVQVGVLDMLRFHRFTIGWAWKSDYGSSETRDGFETLIRYSPLQGVRPGTRYPATLVTTADHDDRVVPGHSFKFTAALQAAQTGSAPVLARIETRAGHGAGKPTQKRIEEVADIYAFLVRVLGASLPEGFGARPAAGGAVLPGAAGR
ncbi:MAG TPA: prolyl oligopeptidase family serine peptidase [Anaeromyxobacteraceae bacterium]|nr:prolyl oligopeptidase family serine peptidase [Anaeromyxobacteraceae bacterium]